MKELETPFPYFGGKRKIASVVWQQIGNVSNYVEPFFGSGAVLMRRPPFGGNETVNDIDGYVANFWRAVKHSPDEVAEYADNPVNENDLHARHVWLLKAGDGLGPRLEGDPEWHDPKIAGWWAWGMSCWIGSGFCFGDGPWSVVDGKLVHLGNGQGVNRKLVHLGDNGQGGGPLQGWMRALSERLRHVRVCCGDWSRVCGPSVTFKHGTTGVFLDPPYADTADRQDGLYRSDSLSVAHDVREWAIEAGKRRDMRIVLAGYEGEHDMPSSWSVVKWNAGAGFGAQADERTGNGKREQLWCSPACVGTAQRELF